MGKTPHGSFRKMVANFFSMTSLIANTDRTSLDNVEALSLAYDSLLGDFPLCYGYWERYAYDMARLHDHSKAVIVYERAVKVAAYSVDLWTSYCSFAMQCYKVHDDVRRLFERALSFVGKDYLCCLLWDKYIEFELANNELIKLAHIYLRTLSFPSKKLHHYYARFRKLVSILEEEMKAQHNGFIEDSFDEVLEFSAMNDAAMAGMTHILVNEPIALFKPCIFRKYLLIGDYLYRKSCTLNQKITCYETVITRTYFHVQSLDESQLGNWHRYLDFVEKDGDLDWTVKLYERCLIPCANYQEFWIRYAENMEASGGREIAKSVIERASKVFLKGDEIFRLYSIRFMERIGDTTIARSFLSSWKYASMPDFLYDVIRSANMEKRLGNVREAFQVYENAILAAEEKHDLDTVSMLYGHFAKFKFTITASKDAAREIFLKGIMKVPNSKYLMEELMQFFILHGGLSEINDLDSIIAKTVYSEEDVSCTLSTDDRVDISGLFLEFVDLYGTIHDVEKAWCRHRRLFPHLVRPVAIELCNPPKKQASLGNNIEEEAILSLPTKCKVEDSFGLSEENLATISGSIEGNIDLKEHGTFAKNKHKQILCDDVEKPNIESSGLPLEPGDNVGENMSLEVSHGMMQISKTTIEVKHQVCTDSAKDIDDLTYETSPRDFSDIENRISNVDISTHDEDSCSEISNSPKFKQTHKRSNMPSQACDLVSEYVQRRSESLPVYKERLEQVEMKQTTSQPQVIHNESTICHNVNAGEDSLLISCDGQKSVAETHVTESLQVSTIQRPVNTQVFAPHGRPTGEQSGWKKFQQHSQEKNDVAKHQMPQGHILQDKGIPSVFSCEAPSVHPIPQYHHQQDSNQLWYYYQQQMYYAQMQQHNLQLQLQYIKNEQPTQLQQNSLHLQMADGREKNNQPQNMQQMLQQQYLVQQVPQNYLYQQYSQSSNQVAHQHGQTQMLQEQLQVHPQHFGNQHIQQQQFFQSHQPYQLSIEQLQQDPRDYQQWHHNQFTSSADHLGATTHLQEQTCTHGNDLQDEVHQQAVACEVVPESTKISGQGNPSLPS